MKNIQNFQEFLAESAINEASREYGFDLTEISANNWDEVLASVGIDSSDAEKTNDGWLWKNDKISIYTANNPVTGEYYSNSKRSIEKNYASYIGLEGDPETVRKVAALIKERGQFKGESPTSRRYI
jgi:hypothetical protein